jgi:hypothetical protein
MTTSKLDGLLSLPFLDLILHLGHRVLDEALEGPFAGFELKRHLLVAAEELDGGIALDLVGLTSCSVGFHIDCAHPDNSAQDFCGFFELRSRPLAVSAPGSCVNIDVP